MNSSRLPSSRPSALTTRTPVMFSLYDAVMLRVDLAHLAVLLQDALAELHRHVQQQRQDGQHDQRQLPVDGEHERQRGGDVDHAPGGIDQPPGHQLGHAFGVVGHAAHDPAHRRAAVIGERQRLQVVEEHAAQVVAHALAHHARQVDKHKNAGGLHQDHGRVADQDAHQRGLVVFEDALVNDLFAQVGEIRVQDGHDDDGGDEPGHPHPVLPQQPEDAFRTPPVTSLVNSSSSK